MSRNNTAEYVGNEAWIQEMMKDPSGHVGFPKDMQANLQHSFSEIRDFYKALEKMGVLDSSNAVALQAKLDELVRLTESFL